MLPQTRDAIHDLKACGLTRHDFIVRVETRRYFDRGMLVTEYGNALITLLCDVQYAVERSYALAKKFTVYHYIIDGVVKHVGVEVGKPRLIRYDVSEKQEGIQQ